MPPSNGLSKARQPQSSVGVHELISSTKLDSCAAFIVSMWLQPDSVNMSATQPGGRCWLFPDLLPVIAGSHLANPRPHGTVVTTVQGQNRHVQQ